MHIIRVRIRDIPYQNASLKWPVWRTPLACSNTRGLTIVYISSWRAEIMQTYPSDVCTFKKNPSQLSVTHPLLSQVSDPFLFRLVSKPELLPLVSNLLGTFPINWKRNAVSAQQSKIVIFKHKSCLTLIFCFAPRNWICLCLSVWLGKHSGVCEAQGVWIAILANFHGLAHMVKS